MARNLKKGSKVWIHPAYNKQKVKGVVIKKLTARKGELNVPNNKRTLVWVKALNQTFSRRPSQLKRRK